MAVFDTSARWCYFCTSCGMKRIPKRPIEHGGATYYGRRKTRRPLNLKKPLHVVMRSNRAVGSRSFLHRRNRADIHIILLAEQKRFRIRVYRFENVGNHIHMLIRGKCRRDIQGFFRVFAQRVMFHVTGARKGRPKGKFFDQIVYSRIVEWGHEFFIVKNYLWKNAMQALGFDRKKLIYRSIPPGIS